MDKIREKVWEKNELLPSYFYFNDKGLLVFTEEYHKDRGYCCGNNCLHCPYEPRAKKGNTTLKK